MLSRLFDHLAWADDRALAALRASLDPDPSAVRAMAHIIGAEESWLARIDGRPPRTTVWPSLTVDETIALAHDVRDRLTRLATAADHESAVASRPVVYTNSAGVAFATRLDDILLHVALHGAYHRGQVAWLVRQHGDTPAATDYIALVRDRSTPAAS